MSDRPMIDPPTVSEVPPLPRMTGQKAYRAAKNQNPTVILILSIIVVIQSMVAFCLAYNRPWVYPLIPIGIGCLLLGAGIYGISASESIREENADD